MDTIHASWNLTLFSRLVKERKSMAFSVEPTDLEQFSKLVSRAGDDIQTAIDFMQKNATIEDSLGDLWQTVFVPHGQHLEDARSFLSGFKRILAASSSELSKSASYYRQTDLEQAKNVDSSYPRSKVDRTPLEGTKGGSKNFTDKEDAPSKLKLPGGEDGYVASWAGEFSEHPLEKSAGTALDFASPSAMVLEFIKMTTGWDPLGDFVSWMAGDWESFLNCADVWGSLADISSAISSNVKAGNLELGGSWIGNSADAAYSYFDEVGSKLLTAEETFNSLKDNYFRISGEIYSFAEFYKGMMVDVIDLGVRAMLNYIAGQAAASSGVGIVAAAAFFAISAKQVLEIMDRWKEATRRFANAAKYANIAMGVVNGTLAETASTVNNFPVPGAAYDNRSA